MGITNQRETTVVWDRHTGQPLHNAIVWHDTRTHSTCELLREKISSNQVRQICGLPISTYFSGVKLRWLMDNVPSVAEKVRDGTALFGTIDTWLVWNLSEGHQHVTDVTNAGRTMMMSLHTLEWNETLLNLLGVTPQILPQIRSSSEIYGNMSATKLKNVPIAGLIGDQQAALVGQSAFNVGDVKNTYGTGCFLIVNTGNTAHFSSHGLLTTPAYKIGDEDCVYSLEGSIANTGSSVSWLRRILGVPSAAGIQELASTVDDTGDVYFVPAFSGLLAPRWREDARGCIVGLTQFTNRAHLSYATLESMAFQVNDVLKAASEDMGTPISQLKVDGGASVNNLLLQMQADIANIDIIRPVVVETTALGAAFVAGHAVGVYENVQAFIDHWSMESEFNPAITEEERVRKITRWNEAVERSLGWADDVADDGADDAKVSSIISTAVAAFVVGALVGAGIAMCRVGTK